MWKNVHNTHCVDARCRCNTEPEGRLENSISICRMTGSISFSSTQDSNHWIMIHSKILASSIAIFVVMNSFVSSLPAILPSDELEKDLMLTESEGKMCNWEMKMFKSIALTILCYRSIGSNYPVSGRQATSAENPIPRPPEKFDWKIFIPSKFGEFFEIFSFVVHRRWHHEMIRAIEDVSYAFEDVNGKMDHLMEREEERRQINRNNFNSLTPISHRKDFWIIRQILTVAHAISVYFSSFLVEVCGKIFRNRSNAHLLSIIFKFLLSLFSYQLTFRIHLFISPFLFIESCVASYCIEINI